MVLAVRFPNAGRAAFSEEQSLAELLFQLYEFFSVAVCCFDQGAVTGYPLSGHWL